MKYKFLVAITMMIFMFWMANTSTQASAAGVDGPTQNTFPSPLNQTESGIAPNDVQCNQDHQLIIKAENGAPECVFHTTYTHLIAIGWGKAPLAKPVVEKVAPPITQNQTSTSGRPIIVAMWRGDVNQDSLYSVFSSYVTSNDYVFPVFSKSLDYYPKKLPGQMMAPGGLLSRMSDIASQVKGKAGWLVYDLEWFPNMTNPPAELQGEYQDYVNSVQKASKIAHDNGFKLLLTPLYSDVKKYDKQFAPYVDMVNLQIPPTVKDYVGAVKTAVSDIKSVNPNAIVTVQYIPRVGNDKVNGDPTSIIAAWKSVKDYADGVFVFYYATPDPTPILKQFYDGMGLSTK